MLERATMLLGRSRSAALLVLGQRVADQPEHRRPLPDEQSAALRVAALILVYRLGPDPEDDAKSDRAERGNLHLPGAQSGAMEVFGQHAVTIVAVGSLARTCPSAPPQLAAG